MYFLSHLPGSLYLESLLGWKVQDDITPASGHWSWLLTMDPRSPLHDPSSFTRIDLCPFLLVLGRLIREARGSGGRRPGAQTLECTQHHVCLFLSGRQTSGRGAFTGPGHILLLFVRGITETPKAESQSHRSIIFCCSHIFRL